MCCPGIPGRLTFGKSHPIFPEPNADLIAVKIQTVGTVIDFLHELYHVFQGLVLGELVDQYRAVIGGIGT